MRLLRSGESGQAMIMALILLAVGGLLIVPTLNLTSTSLNYHRMTEENTQELYAADSGMQYALSKFANNPIAFGPEPLPSEVNDRMVNVTAENMGGGIYKITSTATTDIESSTTIQSYVRITGGLFDYGMLALDGDITMSGDSEVTSLEVLEGDIYANGNISMSGNSEVDGDATSVGAVHLSGNADINGSKEEFAQPIDFPEIDTSGYLNEASQGTIIEGDLSLSGSGDYELGPAHITGNLSISGNRIVRLTGTVWVDGTISMSGDTRIEGPGTIAAIGNITVTGNTKLDPDDIPFIISTDGDITVTGNSWTSAALYAANGDISMAGNSKVFGCVIGDSITVSGNNKVEYVSDLSNRSDLPGGGGIEMLTWQISK